jgi:hypothetical protein
MFEILPGAFAMRMQWVANFLMIFLLGFAQVDDLIFVDATTPVNSVTCDDDEFLPAQHHQWKENSSNRQRLSLSDFNLGELLPNCCFAHGTAFPELCPLQFFEQSSLYVFMSLRR